MITLPTGSVLKVLGPPERAESRFWDAPHNSQQRADAWFWACGCSAEPAGPGRFAMGACAEHAENIRRRFERKASRGPGYGAAVVRITLG